MLPSYRQTGNQLFDVDNFFNAPTNFADPFSDVSSWRSAAPTSAASFVMPSMSSTMSAPLSGRLSNKSPFPQQQQDKYRLTMTLHGYIRDDIKTYIEKERLVVFARHVDHNGDDYQLREFKRHFFVPKNVDPSRMTTNLTRDNLLVVEIPVNLPATSAQQNTAATSTNFNQETSVLQQQQPQQQQQTLPQVQRTRSNSAASTSDYYPQVSGSAFSTTGSIRGSENDINRTRSREQSSVNKFMGVQEGTQFDFEKFFSSPFNPSLVDSLSSVDQKMLEMKMDMHLYSPEQIHLELKERELTLQVQDTLPSDFSGQDAGNVSQHTYKVLLPPKVDLNGLKSKLEDGVLYIEAPYLK